MKKAPPRSHDRKPLVFDNPPTRERPDLNLSYTQFYQAIRLAVRVGEATAQTRTPALESLTAFLHGLNVTPSEFLPKVGES